MEIEEFMLKISIKVAFPIVGYGFGVPLKDILDQVES
jgi:hypothetical protein